jgi:hypothetical protein
MSLTPSLARSLGSCHLRTSLPSSLMGNLEQRSIPYLTDLALRHWLGKWRHSSPDKNIIIGVLLSQLVLSPIWPSEPKQHGVNNAQCNPRPPVPIRLRHSANWYRLCGDIFHVGVSPLFDVGCELGAGWDWDDERKEGAAMGVCSVVVFPLVGWLDAPCPSCGILCAACTSIRLMLSITDTNTYLH